jgi:hypothetical protein
VNQNYNQTSTTTTSIDQTIPVYKTTSKITTNCELNGKVVPCEQLNESFEQFMGWGIGIGILFFIIGVLVFIFWISMIVHAVKYPIEHKPIWILVLILGGILGAIVYYFAVKKPYNVSRNFPPTTPGPTVSTT